MVTMENIGCQQCICNDPFLRPPKAPIFGSTSQQAKAEMIKMQDESEVYQSYIELCGNKTYVPVYSKTSSADSDGWIVPVVIVIILAFVIAIIAVGVYMYKKKGKAGFRKSVMYQNLSQCFFWNDLQRHRNRKASLSSVESKKSESSVGQIQPNSRIDGVVYHKQVSNNEKDFKHSSTAQLIDEPSAHTEEEYSNTAVECNDVKLDLFENSGNVSFTLSYNPDTQTDNDFSQEGSTIKSGTNQKEQDSDTEADMIVSENETCFHQAMSKPTTEEKLESDIYQREKDPNYEKPSSGSDTESVHNTKTPKTEESLSTKSQFDIKLNSNIAGDGKCSIQNQMSVDSGYESRLNSPEQECV
ncbi:uncharacterized protein LOC133176627 isoform X3 [Saccostrea echinata]|uniref:uncharacterized protein LOC133176627 isoform X3 n=1 Tax=Saccostrea echinata TaxID=191078 RepID=UPI002A824F4D|nr:uncharacterized protein LOC133176627 isoform X3 [Saccostrea echinata]